MSTATKIVEKIQGSYSKKAVIVAERGTNGGKEFFCVEEPERSFRVGYVHDDYVGVETVKKIERLERAEGQGVIYCRYGGT